MNPLQAMARLAELGGIPGATSFYRIELPAALAAGAAVTAQASPLNFQETGVVIGMYGQEATATAAKYATTEVRLQMGSRDLVSDGQAGAFLPFLAAFPPGDPVQPLMRRVEPGVPWVFTFKNTDAGAGATPVIILAFLADADVARIRAGR